MSVLSNGPFSYNRFDGVNVGDSVNSAYHAIYEKKAKPDFLDMDKDGDKKEPFKKAVNDKKKGCSDCEGDCKCDDKKEYVKEGMPGAITSGKYGASPVINKKPLATPALKSGKFGSPVSGSGGKERTIPASFTKEDVIAHLIDEGFANNSVSAEVLLTHMSDEWLQSIEEEFKQINEFVPAPAGSPIDRHSRGISRYDKRSERQIKMDNFASKRSKIMNQPKTP